MLKIKETIVSSADSVLVKAKRFNKGSIKHNKYTI